MVSEISLEKIKKQAEEHYANGDFYCSEAIVSAIRDNFQADIPLSAIAMASGFPVGVGGSKCICGAVSGGIMCLGHFFGRTTPKDERVNKAMALAGELHSNFKTNHKVLCCKILTKNMDLGSADHMRQCISFTGEVAEKTAHIIARELGIRFI
ncbi:MAG: C-GCAxxG-C-C family protein [Candidatus Adiutrix sp.]|jgi:C_GCAxxG_C_C family probable redox protein|nr:C-GCAxxG-C-C family protein [Candidatus Adiutrix sp.]